MRTSSRFSPSTAVPFTARALADRSTSLGVWAFCLSAYAVLIVSIYPTVRDSAGFSQAFDEYPDALKEFLGGSSAFDITSGVGFVTAELYSLMLPLLLGIVAIGFGAGLGADQQTGLMELILSSPVSRRRIVLERTLAMLTTVSILAATTMATIAVSSVAVDLGIGVGNLAAAAVSVTLFVSIHGSVAMAVGAATGSRSAAIGIATALFASSYLLSALGGLVDWLEPARVVSLYHHAIGSNPLGNGWSIGDLGVLGAGFATAAAIAVTLFERRDIG